MCECPCESIEDEYEEIEDYESKNDSEDGTESDESENHDHNHEDHWQIEHNNEGSKNNNACANQISVLLSAMGYGDMIADQGLLAALELFEHRLGSCKQKMLAPKA